MPKNPRLFPSLLYIVTANVRHNMPTPIPPAGAANPLKVTGHVSPTDFDLQRSTVLGDGVRASGAERLHDIRTCSVVFSIANVAMMKVGLSPLTENHFKAESKKGQKNFSLTCYAVVPPEVFCTAKINQIYFRPGLCRLPRTQASCGAYNAPLDL